MTNHYQVKGSQLLRRGAQGNLARDVAIYFTREMSGCNGQTLGRHFGQVSGAAITARCKHIDAALATDRKLRCDIQKIKAAMANS